MSVQTCFLLLLGVGLVLNTEGAVGKTVVDLDHLPLQNQDGEIQQMESSLKFGNSRMVCKESKGVCPVWSYCDRYSNSCKCLDALDAKFSCDSIEQPKILECNCATYHKYFIEVGFCIYNCVWDQKKLTASDYYRILPSNISEWTHDICARYDRTGVLCSKCANGSYPRVYSFDMSCMKCPEGTPDWWLYLLAAFFPLTVFYFMILLLHINVHSSHLQGFALYCQLISTPIFARTIFLFVKEKPFLLVPVQIFGSLYGIWNLDFFRTFNSGICLKTSMLTTLTLDLVVVIYPILLMTITYTLIRLYDRRLKPLVYLWKPFKTFFLLFRRHWDIRTSTVDAFATFLFLSNAKLLSVCSDLLIPVSVERFVITGDTVIRHLHWRVYYNATIPYFGDDHVPYAYVAFLSFLVFVVFPILVLTLYPFKACQKCLNVLPRRLQITLLTFVDSFQGCYKDGTDPDSKDFRWFSALPFLIRLCLFIIYALIPNSIGFTFSAMVLVLAAILVVAVDPFKTKHQHFSNQLVMFILSLASFVICIMGGSLLLTSIQIRPVNSVLFGCFCLVLGVTPFIYISVYIFMWLLRHWKFGFQVLRRIQAVRLGYSLELTL